MPTGTSSHLDAPTVCIVDDEPHVRESLVDLFESVEMKAVAFESAVDFLERWDITQAGCILLDVQMPVLTGLDLQEKLLLAGSTMPIIFMTGQNDVPVSVRALKAGAADFLIKPFKTTALVSAADAAIKKDAELRRVVSSRREALACLSSLTPREREVLGLVCEGLMNKQIAFALGISEIMVKMHRGRMMRKMNVRSVAELVRKHDLAL